MPLNFSSSTQLSVGDQVLSAKDLEKRIKDLEKELKGSREERICIGKERNLLGQLCLFYACYRRGYIYDPGGCSTFEELREIFKKTEGFALVLPTSGSLAMDNVVMDESTLKSRIQVAIDVNKLDTERVDSVYCCAPLTHVAGWLIHLLPALSLGIPVRLESFYPRKFLDYFSKEKKVLSHLTPGQGKILKQHRNWREFQFCGTHYLVMGSSEIHKTDVKELFKKGIGELLINYGTTEAGPYVAGKRIQHSFQVEQVSFPTIGSIYPSSGYEFKTEKRTKVLLLDGEALVSAKLNPHLSFQGRFWDTQDCVEEQGGEMHFLGRRHDCEEFLGMGLYPLKIVDEIYDRFPSISYSYFLWDKVRKKLWYFYKVDRSKKVGERELVHFLKRSVTLPVEVVQAKKMHFTASGKIRRLLL